jgi:hypothetical protein
LQAAHYLPHAARFDKGRRTSPAEKRQKAKKDVFKMQYPIDAERAMADFIKLHGPISRSTRNLICAVLELANKAYAAGYRDGRKEVLK